MSEAEEGGEPDPLIGKSVGSYRVEALLGIGGMGRVYRAIGSDGEPVALKLVRSDIAEDSIFRKRFEREARIAQQVKNPHVVPVLDTGEHEGVPYLSQRFIEGGSLEQKLKEGGAARRAARRSRSAPRSRMGSTRCSPAGWCTATSSPPMSCSIPRAPR